MDIGRRIRAVREDLGMPQAELARRAGVASNTIYLIETDRRRPSVGLLEKIARELRTEPAELMRESALPLADASGAGQSGQEWARELDVTLHGMTDEEWTAHVRELDSVKELEEAFHTLLEETNTLHVAHSVYKEEHPEDKDRRIALSSDLRELRTSRFANLATEAEKRRADERATAASRREADELVEEMIRVMDEVAV
jgi:transcriptional regulator with XRE-family HTH domain